MVGSEETFLDTTHGCSFSVMEIISLMVMEWIQCVDGSWSGSVPKCIGKQIMFILAIFKDQRSYFVDG